MPMRARPTLAAATLVAALALPAAASAQTRIDASRPPSQTVATAIPKSRIDQAIGRLDGLSVALLGKTGIPGLGVAVVRDGRVVYAKGFGVRKAGEAARVDADTVFQLASVSKSIGATVVAHQVGKGVIAWDTPVARHLPWFALKDGWVTREVTIADLYAHRSGLPDHAGDDLEDIGYDRRQVLERLRHLPLHPFRSHYAYTNFGMTAAAEAVAVASGTDWASLSETVLYRPLGMTSTSSRYADFAGRANRAVGHVRIDGRYQARYQREPDAQSPAGGVSSSVNDMARWMIMVLQTGTHQGREIVAKDALLPAITAQVVSSPAHAADARAGFYGYGFNVGTLPSGRVSIGHSGGFALGAGTTFLLIPSAQLGIVVLANAVATGAVETLSMEFADLVQFGTVTRDWLRGYEPAFRPMLVPFGARVGQVPPAGAAPGLAPGAYAGTYENAYYGDAVVEQRGTGLVIRFGDAGMEYPLEHWAGHDFVFRPRSENANDGSISGAAFTVDAWGRPSALRIELYEASGQGEFLRR